MRKRVETYLLPLPSTPWLNMLDNQCASIEFMNKIIKSLVGLYYSSAVVCFQSLKMINPLIIDINIVTKRYLPSGK